MVKKDVLNRKGEDLVLAGIVGCYLLGIFFHCYNGWAFSFWESSVLAWLTIFGILLWRKKDSSIVGMYLYLEPLVTLAGHTFF